MARPALGMVVLAILVMCASVVTIASIASIGFAVDYRSDRMNFPPGVSRVHTQTVLNVSGNITVSFQGNFTVVNVSTGGNQTSINITWLNLNNAVVNYTLQGPAACTENDLFTSDIFVNGSVIATLPFICVSDNRVVDFKMEYGHGNANYLGLSDELVIPNRSAVLFNLARVFNLGYLLTPNENPENASLFCQYEILPVRTYGPGEVGRGQSRLNLTYSWPEIRGGYWFRVGVLSQDFTARPPGTSYNVSCQNLTYQFGHTRVQAAFTNYSFLVRTERPFNTSQFNDSQFLGNNLYLIQNIEKYSVSKIKFIFSQANQTAVFEHPRLAPNESLIFRVLNSTQTNLSIYFIPSWFAHSTDPQVLVQSEIFGSPLPSPNNTAPRIINPGNQTAVVAGLFTLQINASDPEGSTLTYRTNSTFFNISAGGLMSFIPAVGQIGNHSTLVNVTDNESRVNSTIFNIEIRNSKCISDANLSRAGLGAEQGNRSSNFSLVSDFTNISGAQFGNNNGTLNYTFSTINCDLQGDPAAMQMIIAQDFVFLNASAFHSSFNQSAVVNFFNSTCPHNLKPVVSLLESSANLSGIQASGRDCVDIGFCYNVSCRLGSDGRGNISFIVNHFTSYATYGNANLTIANNGPALEHETLIYNASYVNASSGALIANAECNMTLSEDPSVVRNMTQGAAAYAFTKKMDSAGEFSMNVTCARPGFTTVSAVGNVSIRKPQGEGGGGGSQRAEASGGAGGAIAAKAPSPQECSEDWQCTPWTPCIGGDRRRTCNDKAGCSTRTAMPLEVEACESKIPVFNITFKPTCSDGIQNQGEGGIDCAGPCPRACEQESPAESERPSTVALACGDGVCADEERCVCSVDCGSPALSCPRFVRTGLYGVLFLLLLVVIVLIRPKYHNLNRIRGQNPPKVGG